jgi:hypothetical protein
MQTLPAAPDEVTPAWLTTALRDAGVLRETAVASVDWEPIGEERGFTGVVARLRPRYGDGVPADGLPSSVVAKFPMAARLTVGVPRVARPRRGRRPPAL